MKFVNIVKTRVLESPLSVHHATVLRQKEATTLCCIVVLFTPEEAKAEGTEPMCCVLFWPSPGSFALPLPTANDVPETSRREIE
jgi:hypothetical protein